MTSSFFSGGDVPKMDGGDQGPESPYDDPSDDVLGVNAFEDEALLGQEVDISHTRVAAEQIMTVGARPASEKPPRVTEGADRAE